MDVLLDGEFYGSVYRLRITVSFELYLFKNLHAIFRIVDHTNRHAQHHPFQISHLFLLPLHPHPHR